MSSHWLYFLIFSLFCVFIEALFSAFEMACVSINKIKLEFEAKAASKRAKWIKALLDKPSRLFGTTLITVNFVMQMGSESARRFYESLSLSPDIAALSQTLLVLIFGELAPLFAARKHAQHVAYLLIPLVYVISKLLSPIVYLIDSISNFANYLFHQPKKNIFSMSREEVKRAFEDVRFQTHSSESDKVNTLINNIFSLGAKRVKDHMIPLNQMIILSSRATTAEYKELLQQFYSPFCFLYHERPSNIIAVIYPRDLLRQPENKPLVDIAHSPWFVTEQANILQIMKQFRYNKQLAAVILNNTGQSVGIMALDQVSDFIFSHDFPDEEQEEPISYIEKTLDGEMLIEDFNKQFNTHLHYEGVKTLSDFIEVILHHHPSQGDVVRIDRFEMTILEVSLKGIKSLSVKTLH